MRAMIQTGRNHFNKDKKIECCHRLIPDELEVNDISIAVWII